MVSFFLLRLNLIEKSVHHHLCVNTLVYTADRAATLIEFPCYKFTSKGFLGQFLLSHICSYHSLLVFISYQVLGYLLKFLL